MISMSLNLIQIKLIKYPLILFLLLSAGLRSYAQPASLSELDPYLKKSVTWKSATLNKEIPLKIYFLGDRTENPDGVEVIVYLKNKAWDRIGQESDLSILRDYIQKNLSLSRLIMEMRSRLSLLILIRIYTIS